MAVLPAGGAARQRLGLEHPPRDRPCQRIGANGAKLCELVDGISKGAAPGRGGEYGVAVEGRVRGVDGAGEAILRDDRKFLGLCLAQRRVGRDQRDGRILARSSLGLRSESYGRHRRWKAPAAELAIDLEGIRPQMWTVTTLTLPQALTATSAPTVCPSRVTA